MDTAYLAKLPLEHQISILYEKGIYIAKRPAGGCKALLYAIGHQYAEITYITYRCEIDKIVYSSGVELLDPYLEQIDISKAIHQN